MCKTNSESEPARKGSVQQNLNRTMKTCIYCKNSGENIDYNISEKQRFEDIKVPKIDKPIKKDAAPKLILIGNGGTKQKYYTPLNFKALDENKINVQYSYQSSIQYLSYKKERDQIVQSQQDREESLQLQIQQQKLVIEALLKSQTLVLRNENTKSLILKYFDLTDNSKKNKKTLNIKREAQIRSIKFSESSILEEIENIKKENVGDYNQSKLFTLDFLELAQQSLVKTLSKYNDFFKTQIQKQYEQIQTHTTDDQNQSIYGINQVLKQSENAIKNANKAFFQAAELHLQNQQLQNLDSQVFPSVAINADIWAADLLRQIALLQQKYRGTKFSAVMMDYPWPLEIVMKNGKKFIKYKTMPISQLFNLALEELQEEGYLFMWQIPSNFSDAIAFMLYKGYRIVDSIAWIKQGKTAEFKNRLGFHVRHSKEVCLIGVKGSVPECTQPYTINDVLKDSTGAHSQKPEKIKLMIEKLLPGGAYIELFGRKNNLRNGWVTVGNEL